MLKIQEFIQNHPDTWEQRLSEASYALKIKRSPFADGRYVMFNYNMLESDNYDPIVAEARGLVLDSENDFKIVRKGFNRFFNYGEGPAAKIDWSTASATLKEDGTLLFLSKKLYKNLGILLNLKMNLMKMRLIKVIYLMI